MLSMQHREECSPKGVILQGTTEEQRAEMLRVDKVKEQQNTLRRAALIIKEYGAEADYHLSDAVSAFADDIR